MAESSRVKQMKGWFLGLGRNGDRTLDQQMTGLQQVVDEVKGKTVIDAGCAEGLISIALAKAGAESCLGLELIPSFVEIGNAQAQGLPCRFQVSNLNDDDLSSVEPADIVLMLAILHKCKDPTGVCTRLAGLAKDLCVIRLPPSGPVIVDLRSGGVPHDIGAAMTAAGFVLEREDRGPKDEWLGYFRRLDVAGAHIPLQTQVEVGHVVHGDERTITAVTVESQRYSAAEVAKAFNVPLDIVPDMARIDELASTAPPVSADMARIDELAVTNVPVEADMARIDELAATTAPVAADMARIDELAAATNPAAGETIAPESETEAAVGETADTAPKRRRRAAEKTDPAS